ncbi:hypothetical protein DV096_16520 [Bradymonadaceae bacterium TMQ3]|uniref:Uncharacterized protein n=1 Tax=Lujinxingia sediminis TaxID=2480984 RepID=A0ABY0CQT2_9DELT|nr:hypothetical protein [Lujinxingia sediminis]RDV37111.1 hypothetical protein DV096_16520 [Bradymonadaceae bacterium TMQ3]RVU42445.1 hypothetical protein EA187_16340 [Lujinxingia sediminis]TXC74645.1 hypothetical protein FRC91_16160 [Bradymonadales bacterium TMQ1]
MLRNFLLNAWSHAPARAVMLCFGGLLGGLALSTLWNAGEFSSWSFGLSTTFALVWGDWFLRRDQHNVDPAAVFASFVTTGYVAFWILRTFFMGPQAGPFADELWTVPNMLANGAFGLFTFLALGSVGGLTYRAARATWHIAPTQRGMRAIAMVVPVLFFLRLFESIARTMSF